MTEPLPANIEKLLQDLQSQEASVRKTAAEELGKSNVADARVLDALNAATVADSNKFVRSAAAQSYLALTGKETAQQPQTGSASTEILKPAARKHSGCLTAFLALALIGNAALGLFTCSVASEPRAQSVAPLLMFAALLNFASAGFAIAIWQWKKWGVYGYAGALIVIALLNLASGDVLSALRAFIPMALLTYLVRSSWEQMD